MFNHIFEEAERNGKSRHLYDNDEEEEMMAVEVFIEEEEVEEEEKVTENVQFLMDEDISSSIFEIMNSLGRESNL